MNTATPRWEWIGITSTGTHNQHVEQAEEFALDAVKNQGRLVEIVHDLNQEDLYVAKAEDDQGMLERVLLTKGKIHHAKEVNEELSAREFSKAPEPAFDWSSVLHMLLGLAGGGGTLGLVALNMRSKLNAVTEKAIEFAKSTEVNDTTGLKK